MNRAARLIRGIKKRHPQASDDLIVSIIDNDLSPNKIFSEWMAYQIIEEGEDAFNVAEVAYYLNALSNYDSQLKNIKLRSGVNDVWEEILSRVPRKTSKKVEILMACPSYDDDVVFEDDRFIVVEPKEHEDSVCYGQNTNKRWCVSKPYDSSQFDLIDRMRSQGMEVRFFIIVNKILPVKHRFSSIGLVSYNSTLDQHARGMTDQQIINQGKSRFYEIYEDDFQYSDEYLLEFLGELREKDIMIEVYDSNNQIIMPSELERLFGEELFSELTY